MAQDNTFPWLSLKQCTEAGENVTLVVLTLSLLANILSMLISVCGDILIHKCTKGNVHMFGKFSQNIVVR